ncbi:hybrid sensor histidine kinase/response regulator [Chromobacterium haemolyticum]|uniref:hybrid sensor histidine kinase/response regulator n=1 Tax=Chromobacterium haemolyticum TaxID=394935 RepID=UPI00244B1174|nr:hybrid sensor histidine kinase/response regulator [Chromobacterium haemolyticum]MDH0341534.1 ATP-binding protein [Chromobacterium haemolyticum]
MENNTQSIGKLIRTSLRLNVSLILVLSLVLLALTASYWAATLLLDEKQNMAQVHFACVAHGIREHEAFLSRGARRNSDIMGKRLGKLLDTTRTPIAQAGDYLMVEGRSSPYSMPFTLGYRVDQWPEPPEGLYALGALSADYYSTYWSLAKTDAPQSFLLALDEATSLAVPTVDNTATEMELTHTNFPTITSAIRQFLLQQRHDTTKVKWASGKSAQGLDPNTLLAYIPAYISEKFWKKDSRSQIMAVSMLEIRNVCWAGTSKRRVFDDISLITPDGRVLLGETYSLSTLKAGLNFSQDGLLLYLPAKAKTNWAAVYRVQYNRLLALANWHAQVFMISVLLLALSGVLAVRWYRLRVLAPAQASHQAVLESEAFNRVITQTAPTALFVLELPLLQPLVVNPLALEWFDRERDYPQLIAFWGEIIDGKDISNRTACLRIGERYLQASFAPARHRGKNAILCSFSDISHYKASSMALEAAKRASDSANEAKTHFLTTISHEIRTPLYGLLGTIEILDMTPLSPRQRAYLSTMQDSSSLLLQLISNVLDVSKIESGQMALESQSFSPLSLSEEVVRAFSAMAKNKRLRLYANLDENAPELVLGDATRIRQILNNLLSNSIKFTESGWIVLRLKATALPSGRVNLAWQVTDTGIGITQEQQTRLFEPFYQAQALPGLIAGTGLGLSICRQLSQLMGGSLRVVSDLGLGSSFTLSLELEQQAAAPTLTDYPLGQTTVLLRAHLKEQGESLIRWLTRQGANTRWLDPMEPVPEDSGLILLDLDPADEWPRNPLSTRVIATPEGPLQAQLQSDSWLVNIHHLKGILQAVWLAKHGLPGEALPESVSDTAALGLNVLVAEDNPINQHILKEQLELLGCRAYVVGNGQEALKHWNMRPYDLVMTDVNMPLMNGYELAIALRGQGVDIPIVGVTANAMRVEEEACLRAGMDAWLVKPINLHGLRTALTRLSQKALDKSATHSAQAIPIPDGLIVPMAMRELFLRTMRTDLDVLYTVSMARKPHKVASILHRINGALAVVNAQTLMSAGQALEAQLTELYELNDENIANLEQFQNRLEAALQRLAAS